jgi:hypothetical protein
MTPSPSPLQTVRIQQKQRLKWLMLGLLAGSGVMHGLAITLVYLKPATVKAVPPPDIEIVLEERDPVKESDETTTSEISTTSGSSGGDETLQVATLNPSAPVSAAESDVAPLTEPEDLSDQDLVNLDLNVPIPPKKKPNADQSKSSPAGQANKDDKGNNSNGSDLRGLASKTGQGAGTGNQPNSSGGDGPKGDGRTNDGGISKVTTPASPTPTPTPKPTPKPAETPVAIVPKPQPPKAPPKKETPKAPPKEHFYEDKEGERLATGSRGRFVGEFDAKGNFLGMKSEGSTGDPELDAAQLRSLNRSLESDPELRQQMESSRGQVFSIPFNGEGETAAEREQIRRNSEIMVQQETRQQEAQPATAAEPAAPTGGIGLPIEAPIPQPETPAAPPPEEQPAPIESADEPSVAAPEELPASDESVGPPEPIIPEEPVAPQAEPIAEPASVEATAEPATAEPASAEPASAEPASAEPAAP